MDATNSSERLPSRPPRTRLQRLRAQRPRLKARGSDTPYTLTLSAWLCLPPLLYGAMFPLLRPLGEAPLLLAIVCPMAACVLTSRFMATPVQIAILVQSVVWLALSLAHVMPRSWTQFYDPIAAIRHWLPMLLIPIFTTAFSALLLRYHAFIFRRPFAIAAVYFAITRLSLFFDGVFTHPDPKDPIPPLDQFFFYSVSNLNIPIQALVYSSVLSKQRSALADCAIILAMSVASTSQTNLIIGLCVLFIRFLPGWKLLPAALGCALLVVIWILPLYAAQLFIHVDGNSGLRAIMWRDAFTAAVQTNGLGVGYGTEWMRSRWTELSYTWLFIPDDDPTRLYVPTHSAFYDMLLRLGFIGAILFVLWYAYYAFVPARLPEREGKIHAMLAVMLFTAAAFNPSITMVNIFIGTAAVMATIEALRAGIIKLPPPRTEKPRSLRQRWTYRRRSVSQAS